VFYHTLAEERPMREATEAMQIFQGITKCSMLEARTIVSKLIIAANKEYTQCPNCRNIFNSIDTSGNIRCDNCYTMLEKKIDA
jgi:protein-arginine kinase activator protein McsA